MRFLHGPIAFSNTVCKLIYINVLRKQQDITYAYKYNTGDSVPLIFSLLLTNTYV